MTTRTWIAWAVYRLTVARIRIYDLEGKSDHLSYVLRGIPELWEVFRA